MAHLGDFAAAKVEATGERSDFRVGFLDANDTEPAVIRVAQGLSALPLMELASVSTESVESSESLGAMYRFLESTIDPDDWLLFKKQVAKYRLDTEAILAIVQAVVPLIGGRPTTQPADSLGGPSSSTETSSGPSSAPAVAAVA